MSSGTVHTASNFVDYFRTNCVVAAKREPTALMNVKTRTGPVNGNGQRHVNWCQRHECGEEDVDWVVVPIPNKGLGIRAKKLLPAGFKIIVEPVFFTTKDHPGYFLSHFSFKYLL